VVSFTPASCVVYLVIQNTTVKEWLKSVHICQTYPKSKTRTFLWPTYIHTQSTKTRPRSAVTAVMFLIEIFPWNMSMFGSSTAVGPCFLLNFWNINPQSKKPLISHCYQVINSRYYFCSCASLFSNFYWYFLQNMFACACVFFTAGRRRVFFGSFQTVCLPLG